MLRSTLAALLLLAAGAAHAACDRVELFGDWIDADRDGLDTREELIEAGRRYSLTGDYWHDVYDGSIVPSARLLDVDHIVPLCLAARWGAGRWPRHLRVQFANDPINLVLVARGANRSKGDRPPSIWLPRNSAEWGWYLAAIGAILDKYPLRPPAEDLAALDCYARFVRNTGKGFRVDKWDC